MRGSDERTGSLFSYVDLEARVRRDHPLRPIREIANAALADLSGDFAALYPPRLGRPSIPPERLLRGMLLQAFYGLRSERQLMERMEFDLLFRWFVGLGLDDAPWDHSSFTKNRDRLLEGEIAGKFLRAVLAQPRVKRLMSSDHFSVDGTLIEAWASLKSFRRKDGSDNDPDGPGRNAERGFHKEKRSNETHQSTTDPEARLYKKGDGQLARLCYIGHALMENRHGLAVDGGVTHPPAQAPWSCGMSVLGRWRIVAMPDYEDDFPDMMEPAYILFEDHGSGEFAFGCVTGQIFGGADTDAVEFSWTGNDEMDEAQGDGWAETQPDGSLKDQICFHGGDEANFIARRETSSTAC